MELGRVGVVLPGGGYKCAFQVGALRYLVEKQIGVEKVQGVSGGALNAAKLAEGGVLALEKVWRDVEHIGPKAVFTGNFVLTIAWHKNAFYTDEGMEKLVAQLEMDKVVSSPVKLEVVVMNEITELEEIFTNHRFSQDVSAREHFRRLIKASASMPGFFQPEKVDAEHIYSDGCFFSLKTFVGFDTIFIIDTSHQHEPCDYSNYFFLKRMLKRFSTNIDRNAMKEIEIFVRTHKYRVVQADDDKPTVLLREFKDAFNDLKGGISEFLKELVGLPSRRLVVISPQINIPTLMLESFRTGDISRSIEHGYECAAEIFKKLE